MEKAYQITENTILSKELIIKYDRFYIWDSCCDFNMIYLLKLHFKFIKEILSFKNITILSAPVSYKNIDFLFSIVSVLSKIKKIEVVVNDLWFFNKIKNANLNIDIIRGNFLFTQMKDPYLYNISNEIYWSKNISIDHKYYVEYFEKNNIKFAEIYNTFQDIKLLNNINLTLYYPFVIYSVSRYCPTKTIFDKSKIIKIIDECSWCKWKTQKDMTFNIEIWEKKIKNFYIWNKQFYENDNIMINENIKRIVYNYDLI